MTASRDYADHYGVTTVPASLEVRREEWERIEDQKCRIRAVARRFANSVYPSDVATLLSFAGLHDNAATRMCLNVIEVRRQLRQPEDAGDWAYLLSGAA